MAEKKTVKVEKNKEINIEDKFEEMKDSIKSEIIDYTEEKIDIEVEAAVARAEKKLIKHKNFSIFKRDIFIILLICLSGFLVYALKEDGYFDKYFNVTKNEEPNSIITDDTKNDEPVVDTAALLIEKYSYLLNQVSFSENSAYLNDFYSGNFTNTIKLEMSLNNVDFTTLTVEGNINIIPEQLIFNAYSSLFDGSYVPENFNYGETLITYLKSQEFYIGYNVLSKQVSNIERKAIKVTEKDDEVIIETIEYLNINNKILNVQNKQVVANYVDEISLEDYNLNHVIYTFVKSTNGYLIQNIEASV